MIYPSERAMTEEEIEYHHNRNLDYGRTDGLCNDPFFLEIRETMIKECQALLDKRNIALALDTVKNNSPESRSLRVIAEAYSEAAEAIAYNVRTMRFI